MKKIIPLIAALIIALTLTGCFEEPLASKAADQDLLKISEKPDRFTLEKALSQSETYVEFADSKDDLLAGDDFLTYIEAARSGQDAEISNAKLLAAQSGAAILENFAQSLATGLNTFFSAAITGLPNLNTATTAGTATGTTGGTATGSTGSGGTTGSPAAPAQPSQAETDRLALLTYYNQFLTYKAAADPAIDEVSASPWLARDVIISDQTLVSIMSSSYNCFNFIKSHPGVADGDMVLSSIGDTMTSIYLLWGLGRYEAQTSYLMINFYYPGGGYVSHAEQQLSLL